MFIMCVSQSELCVFEWLAQCVNCAFHLDLNVYICFRLYSQCVCCVYVFSQFYGFTSCSQCVYGVLYCGFYIYCVQIVRSMFIFVFCCLLCIIIMLFMLLSMFHYAFYFVFLMFIMCVYVSTDIMFCVIVFSLFILLCFLLCLICCLIVYIVCLKMCSHCFKMCLCVLSMFMMRLCCSLYALNCCLDCLSMFICGQIVVARFSNVYMCVCHCKMCLCCLSQCLYCC